jgi:ATP-dependent Zn protease
MDFALREHENKEEDISMSKLQNSNGDNGERPTEDRPPSTPRWVKVSGIIAIVLVLLVVIMMFIGGGKHGPGRHGFGGEPAEQIEQEAPGDQTPSGDHTPPGDGH